MFTLLTNKIHKSNVIFHTFADRTPTTKNKRNDYLFEAIIKRG